MKVIYGKDATRIDLTNGGNDISWASSRGQIAQSCNFKIRESPALASAGYFMLFAGDVPKESEEFFHGPIVNYQKDDKTGDLTGTAYELSWYLQRNDTGPIKLNGDAGKELERIIKAAGIKFSCPAFGFTINERLPAQSFNALYSSLTEKALDKTGIRYFVQHQRDSLTVLPEGNNSVVPMFRPSLIENSSTGESIEEVYTMITVQKYKDEQVVFSVSKENAALSKQIGRMQKIIDAGEDNNVSSLADRQLTQLSRIPTTRSITVHHDDTSAAKLRAGWLIKILEKDNKTITDWIVSSCNARWKAKQYSMDLQLERRK